MYAICGGSESAHQGNRGETQNWETVIKDVLSRSAAVAPSRSGGGDGEGDAYRGMLEIGGSQWTTEVLQPHLTPTEDVDGLKRGRLNIDPSFPRWSKEPTRQRETYKRTLHNQNREYLTEGAD